MATLDDEKARVGRDREVPAVAQWAAAGLLAALCMVIGWRAAASPALVAAVAVLGFVGSLAAVIDIKQHRLPDRVTAVLGAGVMAASIGHSAATTSLSPLVQTVAGGAVVFVVMLALVVAGSGIGGGDVKFSAAAAGAPALVGGIAAAALGLALGLVLVGCAALVARQRGHAVVVFGPGLFAGALLVALAGLAWP